MHVRGSPKKQKGVLLLLVVALLSVLAIAIFTAFLIGALESRLLQSNESQSRQKAAESALIQFLAREGRLPCPADGSLGGQNDNSGIETTCSTASPGASYQAAGILPWRTLGISEADVTNQHSDYFSYRVFSGPSGFTRTDGLDMSACDTDNSPTPTDQSVATVDCENTNYNNTAEQFILGKGLSVVKADNTTTTGVAYVIVDHGQNRRGAWNRTGGQIASTLSSRPEEVANAAAITAADYTGTFYAKALAIETDETSTSYVDDVLSYRTAFELAQATGRYARNWPDNYLSASTTSGINTASSDPASPHFVGTFNSAVADRDFGVSTSSGEVTVSFGQASSTYAGCLWFPVPLSLYDGTNSKTLRMNMEFALRDRSNDSVPGFAVGFIPNTSPSGPPSNDLCGLTQISRTGTGSIGSTSLTVDSTVGVFVNQRVTGSGMGSASNPTLVTSVSSTSLTLSANNTAAVSGTITFSPSSVSKTASGSTGNDYIVVTDLTGIKLNSLVTGTGIATGARVMTASGSTVKLTRRNTNAVSGSVTFSGPSVSKSASGSSGSNTISVSSAYGLSTGMVVSGTGISSGATLTDISSATVGLSKALTSGGSRTVAFRPSTLTDIARDLGWAGGVLANEYSDRFAFEVDTLRNSDMSDPNPERTHLSADFTGVNHDDTIAASCASAASGAGCDKHPTSSSFLVNGSSSYHIIRIELHPDKYCIGPTGTGVAGGDTVVVSSINGLVVGMNVVGPGLGALAKIKSIDTPTLTVTLTTPNVEAFTSQALTFYADSFSQTSSGSSGSTTLTVADSSVMEVGMRVYGTGIGSDAEIASIVNGTSVTLSSAHTAAVSGSVKFSGRRVVAKAWVLSEAGCSADSTTCLAMKNVDVDFSASLATNNEALQIARCISTPTTRSAYESLFFGISTANRGTSGATGDNSYFRRIFSN